MNRRLALIAIAASMLSAAACVSQSPASIGTAKMDADSTIRLQLIAKDGGAIGDAVLVYRPGDPHYDEIKEHLGGLKPGEEKPVPPWPDQKPNN